MFVQVVKLWPPEHPANKEVTLTQWTDAGLAYYEEHKSDDPPAELTPGLHWKVIEPRDNIHRKNYITYPSEGTALQYFRHEWVMMLQARPFVPQPSGTPMPDKKHTVEERARLLSVYLRPWVLFRCHASTHVPHLTELNTVRHWNQIMRDAVRKRCKTTQVTPQRISYRDSWKQYLRGHIVSWHSAKIISNFLAKTCAYSSQAPDVEEPEVGSKKLENAGSQHFFAHLTQLFARNESGSTSRRNGGHDTDQERCARWLHLGGSTLELEGSPETSFRAKLHFARSCRCKSG